MVQVAHVTTLEENARTLVNYEKKMVGQLVKGV
jgi:hypothetical protein